MPNHKKDIDPEQVRKLAAIACTNKEIADIVGCSHDTLTRRFSEDLETGRSQGKVSLRRKQWEIGMAGNVAMLIWLGKQILGQTDKQAIDQNITTEDIINVTIGGARHQESDDAPPNP